mgnify:CR=1 FL=1
MLNKKVTHHLRSNVIKFISLLCVKGLRNMGYECINSRAEGMDVYKINILN